MVDQQISESEAVLREAVKNFTEDKRAAALALIAKGHLRKVERVPGTYVVIDEDGKPKYMVDRYACNCPDAKRRGQQCKHRCAVILTETYAQVAA